MTPPSSDTPSGPEIAVIIPHFNDHARLERCLDALAENDLSGVEVVVADNGSDPAPDLTRFDFVRFVHEPARGAAAARNCAVDETTAPILMFLDADCVPAPDWVAKGRQLAQPDVILGGRVDVFAETDGPPSGAEAFEMVFAFQQHDYVTRKRFSVTANLVTSRALFDRTGPFIVGLSEDMDWCHRALQTGARIVYEDTLAVAHPARQDWPALRKKWLRMTEEGFALNGTGSRQRMTWLLRALAMIPSIAAHLPRILRSAALSSPRDRQAAAGALIRLRLQRCVWMTRQALSGQGQLA